ncbi:MAG: autotransporter assembly complex family protein [bacterium]
MTLWFKILYTMAGIVRFPAAAWLLSGLLGVTALFAAAGEIAIPYQVKIEGINEKDVLDQLRQFCRTLTLRDRPAATLGLLERRAERDLEPFLNILKSHGYLSASTEYRVDPDTQPVTVVFQITPGPVYRLKSVIVEAAGETEISLPVPDPQTLDLETGARIEARKIAAAQAKILRHLQRHAYPLARVTERVFHPDHAAATVDLVFRIDPGPPAVFGETTFEGLETVEESFARNRLRWKPGEPFDIRLVEETQKRLFKTNLFSFAQIHSATDVTPDGALPMAVTLSERKPRSVAAGANYKTDYGPGGKLGWEQRNLWGGGESLSTEASFSGIEYSGHAVFRQPDFLDPDQSLILGFGAAYDNPDPYISRNQTTSVMIERLIQEEMMVRGGLSYRLAQISQLGEDNSFGLLSFPAEFEWNPVDDLLNPTRGVRLKAQAEPFYDTWGSNLAFLKSYAKYSHYFSLTEDGDWVLAGQIGLGSITGAPLLSLPADERFYGGGGGSIRGYPYQSVSPLIGNSPIGGRSIIELSFELRARITENIGGVAFLDGGSAFEPQIPDFSQSLLWGAGVGLRYYTPIGPVRLDVGFPLNRRDGIDDAFQIYVSVGQAF